MTAPTREKKIDQMLMMMELYFDQEKDAPVLKLYHELWTDTPYEELATACREYMKNGKNKYFPKAGQILGIIDSMKRPQGSLEATGQHQWRLVLAAVRDRGEAKGPPVFEDRITNTVVRIQFGWQYLCNILSDKLNWEEKRFCEAYNLASELEPEALEIDHTPEKVKGLLIGIGESDDPCTCDCIKCERIVGEGCPIPSHNKGGPKWSG